VLGLTPQLSPYGFSYLFFSEMKKMKDQGLVSVKSLKVCRQSSDNGSDNCCMRNTWEAIFTNNGYFELQSLLESSNSPFYNMISDYMRCFKQLAEINLINIYKTTTHLVLKVPNCYLINC
jgi:hypothetical protein